MPYGEEDLKKKSSFGAGSKRAKLSRRDGKNAELESRRSLSQSPNQSMIFLYATAVEGAITVARGNFGRR